MHKPAIDWVLILNTIGVGNVQVNMKKKVGNVDHILNSLREMRYDKMVRNVF